MRSTPCLLSLALALFAAMTQARAQEKPIPPLPESVTKWYGVNIPKTLEKLAAGQEVRVVFFGQSLTDNNNKWVHNLCDWLGKTYPKAKVVYVQRSVPGCASDCLGPKVQAQLGGQNPTIVIFQDFANSPESYETVVKNMKAAVPEAEFLVWSTHMTKDTPAHKDWFERWEGNLLPQMCEKYKFGFLHVHQASRTYLKANYDDEWKWTAICSDGVHLNAEGQRLLFELMKLYFKSDKVAGKDNPQPSRPAPEKPAPAAAPDKASAPAPITSGAKMTLDLGKDVRLDLILVPAGKFIEGSPDKEPGHADNEAPQREVTISRPFLLSATLITQEQAAALGVADPSKYKGGKNPVDGVTYEQCLEFCKKASEKTGRTFRLPTSAEWEYANRAGTTTAFFCGTDLNTVHEYSRTHVNGKGSEGWPVMQLKSNPWGFYDFGGYFQWCSDFSGEKYTSNPAVDPNGPEKGSLHVVRGGTYHWPHLKHYRAAWHEPGDPSYAARHYTSFRVVVEAAAAEAANMKPAPAANAGDKEANKPSPTADAGSKETKEAKKPAPAVNAGDKENKDAKPSTDSKVVVVWNGEDKAYAWSWQHGSAKVVVSEEEAHSGTKSVKFTGKAGDHEASAGWHWFDGTEKPGGIDGRQFTTFSFWVKVKVDCGPKILVAIRGLQTSGPGISGEVDIAKYTPKFADGDWHEVVIPLKDFAGRPYDQTTLRELVITVPSATRDQFSVYFDDLTFDNRSSQSPQPGRPSLPPPPQPAQPAPSRVDDAEEKALQVVKKYSGWVKRDEKADGKPVIGLGIANRPISDGDLKELVALRQLQELRIHGGQITDAGVKELTALKQLQTLDLTYMKLTDAGVKDLLALKQLHVLNLHGTRVTDVSQLAALTELQELGLHEALSVSGASMAKLKEALPKCKITR